MIYLSICIPTFKRFEITKKTIASIYSDLDDVDLDEFEVIVSDNDPIQSSAFLMHDFPFPNFHYFKTDCDGFLNSFYSLGYGKGAFLKLHNNYTMLKTGTLKYLIDEVKENLESKADMFFSNGKCGTKNVTRYNSFDDYMYNLSYFSSWSTGFGIWKIDYDRIKTSVKVSEMFPQTSLLITEADKGEFILNDMKLFVDQSVPRKGGYNPYKVFGIDYLNLIKQLLFSKRISIRTYSKIKDDLLIKYLASRYFKSVIARMDNFDCSDARKSLSVEYGKYSYYRMLIYAFLSPFYYLFSKIK